MLSTRRHHGPRFISLRNRHSKHRKIFRYKFGLSFSPGTAKPVRIQAARTTSLPIDVLAAQLAGGGLASEKRADVDHRGSTVTWVARIVKHGHHILGDSRVR